MLDGIVVQNDPINLIDPLGLLTTGQNIFIGLSATATGAGSALLITASAPVIVSAGVPILVGAAVGGFATVAWGGDLKEAAWNAATGGLGGPFGWLAKGAPAGVGALGLLADFGMDFLWAGTDPPWEVWPFKDDPCP